MAQGYNDRLDESLGAKHPGKHSQSLKDRRDESEAMEKKPYHHKYGADGNMEYRSVHKHLKSVINK
jgi:hypothetical protein